MPQAEKKDMMLEGFRIAIRMLVEDPFTGAEGQYLRCPSRNVVPEAVAETASAVVDGVLAARIDSASRAAGRGRADVFVCRPRPGRAMGQGLLQDSGRRVRPHRLCDESAGRHHVPVPVRSRREAPGNWSAWRATASSSTAWGTTVSSASTSPATPISGTSTRTNPHEFAPPDGRTQDGVGTPEMLRTRLREFEDAGIDQVVCLSQAGKIPHDLLCSSIELFTKEVLPEFKDRDQKRGAEEGGAGEPAFRNRDAAQAGRRSTQGKDGHQGGGTPLTLAERGPRSLQRELQRVFRDRLVTIGFTIHPITGRNIAGEEIDRHSR